MPMEGDPVAGINIDGIALHAVLLQLLLFRAEAEVCGPAHLSWCIVVWRRFNVQGPGQLLVIPALLYNQLSWFKILVLDLGICRRGREREGGAL